LSLRHYAQEGRNLPCTPRTQRPFRESKGLQKPQMVFHLKYCGLWNLSSTFLVAEHEGGVTVWTTASPLFF